MNVIKHLALAFSFLSMTAVVCVAAPSGKTQQLASPDQVPEGLAKSDWTSIRAAYEAGRHAFQPIEGGWQARNPGQQWTTKFDGRGFVSEPKGGGWQWGLELKRYGFPGATSTISGVPTVTAEGKRLTYGWDATVQEWWVNDARGLEHGFTVRERPASGSDGAAVPLQFVLAVRGTLTAQIAADGLGVLFCDAAGNTVINYSGLKVWDADGKILRSRFQPVDPNNPALITLAVDERGARYPLTIDPIAQQAYLKASNSGSSDQFGARVAVSGDTVVVGAYLEDSSTTGVNSTPNESATDAGAVYVFVRNGTNWAQQAYLKASNTGANDYFGHSVAVSGDTVVVGAYAEDSSTTGVDSTPNEDGYSAGAAYVFVRSGTNWTQQAYLKASNTGMSDWFGSSVAVSGDTVVVGARSEGSSSTGVNSTPNEDAFRAGAAYVFVRNGTTWSQQAYLKASNTGANDYFGHSVAVSGDTVVVSASGEDSSTTGVNSAPDEISTDAGAAYVFVRTGTTWSQQAFLKASNTGAGDGFGGSVAVSGDTAVVSASGEDSITTGVNSTPLDGAANTDAGAAYVFVRSGTNWTQQAYLKASNTGLSDWFGNSVAVSGDTVVVGALFEDSSTTGVNSTPNNSAGDTGAAYVFVRSGTNWTQQAYLKASNTGVNDYFGASVAVSGDTVVVGAYLEDSSTTGVNSPPNELGNNAGAAYIFSGLGPANGPEIAVQQPAGNELVNGAVLDFGFVPLGNYSAEQTFTISNVGNATLTLTNIAKDGSHPGDFSVGALGQTSLAPGASTTFSVTFSPRGYGSRSAAIHLTSNDGDESPFDITLTGAEGTNRFQWARRVASTTNPDDELAIGMTVDSSGNAYVTGWFDRTNDFGGVTLTNKSGSGQDIFVAKYNSAGSLQWARRAGGSTSRPDAGRGVGVDNSGSVYVTGGFHGTADFGAITRTASDLGEYFSDFFLAKYDSAGTVQWVQQSVGGFGVYGTGLAVDGAGNSYAVGYAENAEGFWFGSTNLINTNLNGYSAFLVKYDSAGTPQWATLMGGTSNTYATKVAVDGAGNVYVRGSFLGNMRIGTSNLFASGASEMFFAKFTSSGALAWVRQTGGSGFDEGGVAVDLAGNVYVSGAFGGNPKNFDGIQLTNAGSFDAFLAKFNSSGVIQWARRAGGTDLDIYLDVAVDSQGNVYPVGALSSNAVAPNGSGGAMVAKYDAAGTLQWAHSGSGLPASPVGSVSAKSAVDPAGNAYLAGWYRTPTTFGTNVLQTNGYWNYFLAKLPAPTNPIKFDNLSVSNGNFALRLIGASGSSAAVDTSANLTNWTAWQTNTLTNGSWSLLVPIGTNRQYFRARLP